MEGQKWKRGSLEFQQFGERGTVTRPGGRAEAKEEWICLDVESTGLPARLDVGVRKREESRVT